MIKSGAIAKMVEYAIAAASRGALSGFHAVSVSLKISNPMRGATRVLYPGKRVTSRAMG
jgi:hypothetical protein